MAFLFNTFIMAKENNDRYIKNKQVFKEEFHWLKNINALINDFANNKQPIYALLWAIQSLYILRFIPGAF